MDFLKEQDVDKSYRILGIGATTLIVSADQDDLDVMAAAWAGVCDFDKGYAIIAKEHYSRKLIEKSKRFIMCYPSAGIVQDVMKLGTISKNDDPQKLENSQVKLIEIPGFSMKVPAGCVAYLEYEVIDEPHNQQAYDMFIGKCVKVVTDSRVYDNNHWLFDTAPDELKTLHYVAGGHFFKIGKELVLEEYGD